MMRGRGRRGGRGSGRGTLSFRRGNGRRVASRRVAHLDTTIYMRERDRERQREIRNPARSSTRDVVR